jgi:Xaa-Pro dipeptidase
MYRTDFRSGVDVVLAKQHARRVQEKLGVETGLIYLPGQQSKTNDDSDMPAPFRQLRYFYYLTGFVDVCHCDE